MKNNIIYYYNIYINNLYQTNNYFYFYLNNQKYELTIYTKDIKKQKEIYQLNQKMLIANILVNEIIPNKDNNIVTIINNIPYILCKINVNEEKEITLQELTLYTNYRLEYSNLLKRDNWNILWSKKIDYFEYQINQMGKKYPILVDTFAYYIGLAENAISYVKNTLTEAQKEPTDFDVISREKININDKIKAIYNPLNIVIDHKARDIAEYIKISFFKNNNNIINELDQYFKKNFMSYYGMRLLFARVLYPSYYFELYEQIIQGNKSEEEILNITSKTNEYEEYLNIIFNYLNNYYNLPEIEWLKKRRI